jgi:hypothetical protein
LPGRQVKKTVVPHRLYGPQIKKRTAHALSLSLQRKPAALSDKTYEMLHIL